MSACCVILVVLIIVVLLAGYWQRRWIMQMWSNRPSVVLVPRGTAVGGDDYRGDDYQDSTRDSEDDIYGNFDSDPTYGGGPFRLRVSDPEYTSLLDGKKTIEVRPDKPPFTRIKAGDQITVVRARPKGDTSEYPGGMYKHNASVVRVTKHANLEAALKTEGVGKVYPGKTAAEATARFKQYLPPNKSENDPVIAFELKAEKGAKPAKK